MCSESPLRPVVTLLLATSAALSSLPAQSTVFNDTFADGERTTQNLPSSVAWYLGQTAPELSVRNGVLEVVSPGNAGRTFWSYFPVVSLKVGEVSFTLGYVVGGNRPQTVMIRAIGPTLGAPPFNMPDVVANPRLELFAESRKVDENDDWGGTPALVAAFALVGAFALPANSRDAAILATLAPGSYSAVASGVDNTTGVAIVEVYEVP